MTIDGSKTMVGSVALQELTLGLETPSYQRSTTTPI